MADDLTLFSFPLLAILSISAFVQAHHNFSFTAELIHRDSPDSPFYNASQTPISRLANAIQRSHYQLQSYGKPDKVGIESSLIYGDGNYLMKINIGTPPTELLASIDMASNILWIPCIDCPMCQKSRTIFNPSASSTYRNAPCDSRQCLSTNSFCESDVCFYDCQKNRKNCPNGTIATDTISLSSNNGKSFTVADSNFICGNHIDSQFGGFGKIGLGRGPLSLTAKFYDIIDGQFSYCLVPFGSKQSSKINFGDQAFDDFEKYGITDPAITTLGQDSETGHYYVTMTGISLIGTVALEGVSTYYPGKMLIDTETMFTSLPKELLIELKTSISYMFEDRNRPDASDLYFDSTLKLSPCYKNIPDSKLPKITLHLLGADVELDDSNSFIRINDEVSCLAFQASQDNITVLGSWQLMNFLVGYDLKEGTAAFEKIDCTKNS